ncbi:MAG: response regulator [Deltaproteobacteria bacterium]|nr:response regulator [Deltaproteobacteria bacterium]
MIMIKNILVIDDKTDDLNNITTLLKDVIPDCRVIAVRSALEGLERAKTESPVAILLGICAPEMERDSVCNRLKSDENTRRIPVIMMMEAQSDPDRYVKGLDAGADAFLNKPITRAELKAQIRMVSRVDALEKEKTQLKKHLQQAQKMEAIGTLAGGIAHEFNNILFPIIGYTEMSMYDIPENSKTRKNLAAVLKAADRAKDLIQQILSFSRKGGHDKILLKIQYVIKETLRLLRASLPATIEIRQAIDNACAPVAADPSEIQQILMNLSTNAYQAMEEKGGILEITLSEIIIDSSDVSSNVDLSPGSYLQLTVKDTGHGIETDQIKHIFDPNYRINNQNEGKRTGLGMVYEIVQSYNGVIDVDSEPGRGTTVSVYLPLPHRKSEIVSNASTDARIPTGDETILLVDDEEDVLEMMHLMLERLGYRVFSKTSSIEALEEFHREPEKFDLVITDQTMPKMTGMELIQKLMHIRSDIPIILCTGFNEKITEDNTKRLGIDALISKPVRVKEVALTIREVLNRK